MQAIKPTVRYGNGGYWDGTWKIAKLSVPSFSSLSSPPPPPASPSPFTSPFLSHHFPSPLLHRHLPFTLTAFPPFFIFGVLITSFVIAPFNDRKDAPLLLIDIEMIVLHLASSDLPLPSDRQICLYFVIRSIDFQSDF